MIIDRLPGEDRGTEGLVPWWTRGDVGTVDLVGLSAAEDRGRVPWWTREGCRPGELRELQGTCG